MSIYYYIVCYNEAEGFISAVVNDDKGNPVYEIKNPSDLQVLIDAGCMRNFDDLDGLEQHLKDIGLIPSLSQSWRLCESVL